MNFGNYFNVDRFSIFVFLIFSLFFFAACQQDGKIEVPSDERITTTIQASYDSLPEVPDEGVTVSTEEGIVTLSGEVSNLLAKRKATEVAQKTHGVLSVVNNVKVTTSRPDETIKNAIQNKVATNPVTEFWEITSTVNNGVVSLKGVVDSWQQRRLVEKLAMQVSGVKEVNNTIIVKPEETRSDQEIKQEVEQALKMDSRIADARISVEVDEGDVTLSGQIGNAYERTLAREAARITGVSSVAVDRLEVHPEYERAVFTRKELDTLSPSEIEQAIERALRYDPHVPHDSVAVSVTKETATLSGTVQNLNAKLAAESDARHTAGISTVENNIKVIRKVIVSPDIPTTDEAVKDRVETAISTHPYVKETDINVAVDKGVVVLSGTVNSKFEKDQIYDLATEVKGVIDIVSELEISGSDG